MEKELENLLEIYREIRLLQSVRSLLSWDQETYMPPGGGKNRSEQIAVVSAIAHRKITSVAFRDLLGKFVELDSGEVRKNNVPRGMHRMLEEIWRDYHKSVCLPPDFVQELSRHISLSQQNWAKARKEDEFGIFAPYLEKMIKLKKQQAEYIGYSDKPYDALLDLYEPGMRCETVEELFGELRKFLVPFLKKLIDEGRPVDDSVLFKSYEPEKQWKFGVLVLKDMGFDFNHGRQDKSAHPFTTGFHPDDVRLTTRIYENDLRAGLFGTIHEGGHGLYEQGLEKENFGNPYGDSISLGIHESQSRLWENLIGRSRAFWQHYYPILRDFFPDNLNHFDQEDFYRAVNSVRPSLIRVEADEVTYNLHIMLRFDLEQKIINADVNVNELPDLWNRMMEEYIGIRPDSDKNGVLQDIHWSMGSFGYFPTYSLGNLYSVQIMRKIRKDISNLDEMVKQGNLHPLREWLKENIHKIGRRKKAEELLSDLTGEKLSSQPFIEYIRQKFTEIYGIEE